MKRNRKILSLVLCMAMLITCFAPMSAYAGLVGSEKAKVEFIPLKSTNGTDFTEMSSSDISSLVENDVFYVGAKASGFDQIEYMTSTDGDGGLTGISFGLNFDTRYLLPEPELSPGATGNYASSTVNGALNQRSSALLLKSSDYTYSGTGIFTSDVANQMTYKIDIIPTDPSAPGAYTGTTDGYLAVMKFKVIALPTSAGNTFAASVGESDYSFDIGPSAMGGHYQYSQNNEPDEDILYIMNFDVDALKNLLPAGKAPLGGTASITGTTTYGETLEVDVTSVTGATSFTYQWNDGTNDIAGATSKTFTVNNPTLAGKTLKCVVKSTEAAGSVTATAAAPIAKKQLTVSGTTITAKPFDNTTNATATGTTLTGKVGSDVVSVKATAAFADKNAGTNKNVTVTYALSGAAAGAYELDKTTETLQGTINKAELTVAAENKQVKVNGQVTLTAKVTGEVSGAPAGATFTYAVKDGSADVITVSGDKATGVAAGTETITATCTITDMSNYAFKNGTNTADATVTVADKVPSGIAIKTQPTKTQYEAGEVLDLTGLEVTVTYDDNTKEDVALADFAGKNITATPANGTALTVADHHNKPVTVSINGKTATTSNLTVTAATTKVTLKTKGAATKKYDGTTAVTSWTTEPEFESNNGTVDTSKAVYTFAQAGVGTNLDITVTGLTVNGEAASISGSVADGTITIGDTTLAITSSASQTVGSVRIAVNATPTDPLRTIKIMSYQVVTPAAAEVPCSHATVTDGAICTNVGACDHTDGCGYVAATAEEKGWVELTDSQIAGLKEGKYTLKAVSDATANTTAGASDEFNLTVNKKSSGGGGGGGSVVTDYTVKFSAGDHGKLEGKLSVTVAKDGKVKSSDIPKVTPEEGYVFAGWTLDGKTTVDPTAAKVTANVNYTALYKASKGTHGTFMSGYTDGSFRPDGNTTRAEVASLMAGLIEGYDKNGTYTTSLNDIDSNEWYAQAVKFMSAQGLITGYDDGSFRPGRQITRQEFCAIIAKYLDLKNEGTTDFNDVADAWGQGFIAQLATKGIVSGYPDGSFMPDKAITRAEVTTILNKVFDRVPDQKLVDENIGNYTVRMSDVTKDHWAYYQILEAAMEHEVADFH